MNFQDKIIFPKNLKTILLAQKGTKSMNQKKLAKFIKKMCNQYKDCRCSFGE